MQYDPGRVSFSWNGIRVYGWAADTFIKAERNEDQFKTEFGAQGDAVRIQSQNKGGKITITLQSQSPVNQLLSDAVLADAADGTAVGPLLLKDGNGLTFAEAQEAWIMKPADIEFNEDGGTREWVFDCADLNLYSGATTR